MREDLRSVHSIFVIIYFVCRNTVYTDLIRKFVGIYVLQGPSRRESSEENLVRDRFILRSSVYVLMCIV